MSVTEQHNGETPAKKKRKRRLSPKIVEAVRLIATGTVKNQKAAAERVGVSEQWLSTMLSRDENRALLTSEVEKNLRKGTLRASARIVELLDSESSRTSFEASKHLLGIAGFKPPADSVNVRADLTLSVGYVLDLRDPSDERPLHQVIDVTPQRQNLYVGNASTREDRE